MNFRPATALWDFRCPECGNRKFKGAQCMERKDKRGRVTQRLCSVDCVEDYQRRNVAAIVPDPQQ